MLPVLRHDQQTAPQHLSDSSIPILALKIPMITKNKSKYISIFAMPLIFFPGINSMTVSAKTDLVIEGNVLGYELYSVRPFSCCAIYSLYPALIRVTKVVEGTEKSQYILVF